ncbi:MAG: hypothetical protein D6B27_05255 [Gammaproteobacteria bacterium]|nr:MAG: hypothetical protein D6B27_05255 [Gammaproteobacteria bacterium]
MRYLILLVIGCFATICHAKYGFYSFAESESYSEVAPIKQTINDLKGDAIDRGSIAFTHNQLEIGVTDCGWQLGIFKRYDYLMLFNNDAAQIIYHKNNDISPANGREFNFYLNANHIESNGINIGYSFSSRDFFKGSIKLNYILSRNMTLGNLHGMASSIDDDLDADLWLDYNYSRDVLLERPEENVKGKGYSLDLSIKLQPIKDLIIAFGGYDVVSKIQWKDITYTKATATTNIIEVDEDGFPSFIPVISGVEKERDVTQKLPKRYFLSLNYTINESHSLIAEAKRYHNMIFPYLGYRLKAAESSYSLGYGFKSRAPSIKYNGKNFGIGIAMDHINPEKAKYLNLLLSYRVAGF